MKAKNILPIYTWVTCILKIIVGIIFILPGILWSYAFIFDGFRDYLTVGLLAMVGVYLLIKSGLKELITTIIEEKSKKENNESI